MAASTALTTALALALVQAPGGYEDDPPGGYSTFGDAREREPNDGEKKVFTGSLLLPLGTLRLGMGVGMYVMATDKYCKRVYGPQITEKSCDGLQVYGLIGVGMGGLMAITGAVFLAWGLSLRAKHHRWMRDHGLAVAPMVSRQVQGVTLGFRF